MYLCYIDESGDSQPIKAANDDIQPLLVVAGIFISSEAVRALTADFIALKRRFYPAYFAQIVHPLDVLLKEMKGSDIRRDIRDNPVTSAKVMHHFRFLDEALRLLKAYDARLVARIWVKRLGVPLTDKSIYPITTQNLLERFEKYLEERNADGMVIADFRDPHRNSYVAHSVFTQKHKKNGDAYPRVRETPTFGISNNHACLQIADLLCSSILAPMAGRTFCHPDIKNAHTHANYDAIAQRYSKRVRALQYHCDVNGHRYWGITASENPHGNGKTILDFWK